MNLRLFTPAFSLIALLLPAVSGAQGIRIAFHNGAVTSGAMTTSAPGTVVNTAAHTWNNIQNNGGVGLAFSNLPLAFDTGPASGATLSSSAGASQFNSNGWGGGNQDWVMMEGWFGLREGESLAITNLPAAITAHGYTVTIYGDSDSTSRAMSYTVTVGSTPTALTIQDSGTFAGTFTSGANFVTFPGLAGSSFTITGNPAAGANRSAVNGIIITPDPPPVPEGASDTIHIALHDTAATAAAMNPANAPATQGERVRTDLEIWNPVVAPATGNGPHTLSNVPLVFSNGVASPARLSANTGFVGTSGTAWQTGTKDHVMMHGWFGFATSSESLQITGIPVPIANRFHVIVYGDSNATERTMNYNIGGQTRTLQDSGTFAGTFADGTHFAVLTGLSGSSFTLTGNAATPRSAVNGLSIIAGDPAPALEIAAFNAIPQYVQPGGSTTLTWQVENSDSVEITPGIGLVTGNSLVVTPATTTTYTLTATRGNQTRRAMLRVGVGPPRPNLLFFFVDDMGWQDTSVPFLHNAQGQPVSTPLNLRYRTPAMETLAARGVRFTRAYSMPVCTPSRVCWMTGLNSARHHVTNWTNITNADTTQNSTPSHRSPAAWRSDGLPQHLPTLPALLQNAGYRTIHAGKAHFGNSTYARNPLNVGFDVNIAGSEIGHPGSYSGTYGQGTTHAVPGLAEYHNTGTHLSKALTLELNKQLERAVADGIPFFAYMAHYAVHSPFQADPRFTANYPGLTGNELAYATLIEGMDQSLGDILAKIEQLGVAENTFVLFMSDNGGDAPMPDVNQSNAPLRHKKGSKYEGGSRVPMLAAWAKRDPSNSFQTALPIPANGRVHDLVAILDLFPTFAAVAGVTTPDGLDGHNLGPYLRAEPGTHRPQELILHFPHDHRSAYFTNFHEDDWKLIHNFPPDNFELYHLASDISESNNLAAAEPLRLMRMARKMARSLHSSGAQWPRFSSNLADDPLLMPQLAGVDSDGDGIPDILEDPNRNGLVDPGETDPDNPDTDGDGLSDGLERKTGTDPLNPASLFQAHLAPDENAWNLRWPSAPGATYRIESTIDPAIGWDVLLDDVPASPGAQTTLRVESAPSPGIQRFFRVFLK